MKKLHLLFLLFSFNCLQSQTNLVPNPSFEMHDTCPNAPGQVNYITNWNTLLNSPDYYNACAPNVYPSFSVPYNFFGYQNAASGNAYAGFWVYDDGTPTYREFLGTSLVSPLVVGQKYYVSFKLNLSLGYISNTACNKTGLRFTNIQHTHSNPPPINNTADIYTTSIITDTLNWTTVFSSFTADSSYNFIEMGNFFDTPNTSFIAEWSTGGSNGSYYYIDDVCISTDSLYSLHFTDNITKYNNSEQVITLYPNPSNGKVFIKSNSINEKMQIDVYEVYGNKVKNIKISADHTAIEFEESGIYFITISNGSFQVIKKVIINK